jgi:RimJ/RimL family protein N-acetyltransferase
MRNEMIVNELTADLMVNVALEPWSHADLPLLRKLMSDPNMMAHLGGPESEEQILRRQQRYVRLSETRYDRMFKIVWGPASEAAGSVGYWERTWQDRLIYEVGWLVLPEYQGHGIATKAAEIAIAHARLMYRHRFMHAFPSISNAPSNAICRKLGFSLIEECQFEYPPGNFIKVNDWCLDLFEK